MGSAQGLCWTLVIWYHKVSIKTKWKPANMFRINQTQQKL